MSDYPRQPNQAKAKPRRQRFADGSAVVTYGDGSVLILESVLAKLGVLGEPGPVDSRKRPKKARLGGDREK